MRKMLMVLSALMILTLAVCELPLAAATSNGAAQEQKESDPIPEPFASLGMPTEEQEAEMLAVYQRFVALCQARGEIISDEAFVLDPNRTASFGADYLPVEGVKFTGIPALSAYYLNISGHEPITWERHRAFWSDMVRAGNPEISAEQAAQAIDTMWDELREAHPGAGVWDGHFEAGGWGFTVIKSPDDQYSSTLMAGPITEPIDGSAVFHVEASKPKDSRMEERRVKFRSLIEALGMTLVPGDEPVDSELGGLHYAIFKVTDTLEWTDLSDPEDGTLLAHCVLHPSQDTTPESVSDLTRSVLQAAVMAAAELDEEMSMALVNRLIDSLEEDVENNRLICTLNIDEKRIAQLRAGDEDWFILISVGE